MSHAEILEELPKLTEDEREEIFERICDLRQQGAVFNSPLTDDEKMLLDQEWEDYLKDKDAGTPWREVMAELRARSKR